MTMHHVIIAGASGLVGQSMLHHLLQQEDIATIYSLGRRSLHLPHTQLVEFIHPQLAITAWDDNHIAPDTGFICLGTTLREAGSKAALKAVDVDLVIEVAKQMHYLGVKRLGVVSSHGASSRHVSHYLRCKGKMEEVLSSLGFEHLCFVRPGPLRGERDQPRADEALVDKVTQLAKPLLKGPLKAFEPIDADDVAIALFNRTFEPKKGVSVISATTLHAQK
ncbi:NAD-dependent epimerase/dehydratase family protein [Thaumasiovibrio subtropicus]|uniref:NAD-dependent epimerase/dehydratase family protein n=1 Tax=Thaumasiovibrio subtropicus TaxID=1891207 RepID=UPI000B3512B8|nr:NAD-dependent epimerase/dehydratase family protein [Thaumasiovibrio subtropicus]